MQQFWPSLRMILFMTFLTGLIYPLSVLLIANLTMPWRAQGSLIHKEEKIVGSKLVGQKFSSEKYFWGRPSAVNYNTLPAGASNLGPTSAKLQKTLNQRRLKIAQSHNVQDLSSIPVELICASGSGIDPHISIETAYFQIPRIMKIRSLTGDENKQKIYEMINSSIDKPVGRFFGIPHVNVLILNLKLDEFEQELEKNKK